MKLGVLTNPQAGRGRAARVGAQVREYLQAQGARVVDVSGPGPFEAGERTHDAAAAGVDAVVVIGGDGTVNLGVNAVAGLKVPLGIVPAGTGNDAARVLGIPTNPLAAAQALWDRLETGRMRTIDAAAAVLDRQHGARWFFTAAGAGLDAAITMRAARMRLSGSPAYAAAVLAELPGLTPYGFRLTVDGTESTLLATLISIANSSTVGGGLKLAPMADFADGNLDIVVAAAMARRQALALFPQVYTGSHMSSSRLTHQRGRTVRLEASGAGKAPALLCADGEVFGPLPATIAIHPGALMVLA